MTSLELNKLKLKNEMLQNRKMMFGCIQYEVLRDIPVDVAYKNFCLAFGEDAMKYADFDFWYYQIVNGEFDLNHDRSTDPPAKELSDMPVEVSEEIFGNLEWNNRCAVRKVSRNCQFRIDNTKLYFTKINLNMNDWASVLDVEDQVSKSSVGYEYPIPYNDYQVKVSCDGKKKVINETKIWKPAINDFIQILKCKKVKIDELKLSLGPEQEEDRNAIENTLKDALVTIMHKTSVKALKVYAKSEVAVLHYLKPGALERIEIQGNDHRSQINIDEYANLDQWKQAKELRVEHVTCNQVNVLFNMTEFDVNIPTITNEDFIRLKNALRSSAKFENGRVNLVDETYAENLRAQLGMEQVSIEDEFTIRFEPSTIRFDGRRG